RSGGVCRVERPGVRHYGSAAGLPTSTGFRFAEDGRGRLWAATFTGPHFLQGQRWVRPTQAMGYPGRQARTLFPDREGNVWV
ncbi:hypothetical protein, partial [Stenotrophomonas sp. SrG]|uniref:hypothetical protein n=1 Tax=Stenotrophomonas sp. SrG TaxID=3414430 RepID=UPI003CF4159C